MFSELTVSFIKLMYMIESTLKKELLHFSQSILNINFVTN